MRMVAALEDPPRSLAALEALDLPVAIDSEHLPAAAADAALGPRYERLALLEHHLEAFGDLCPSGGETEREWARRRAVIDEIHGALARVVALTGGTYLDRMIWREPVESERELLERLRAFGLLEAGERRPRAARIAAELLELEVLEAELCDLLLVGVDYLERHGRWLWRAWDESWREWMLQSCALYRALKSPPRQEH